MPVKINWQVNSIYTFPVEDLYIGVCQVRENGLVQFFVLNAEAINSTIVDLNDELPLFCIFVADVCMRQLRVKPCADGRILPSVKETPREMLSAVFGMGQKGAVKVRLGDDYSAYRGERGEKILDLASDFDCINDLELAGMWGDADKILQRIRMQLRCGYNIDSQKEFLYPGYADMVRLKMKGIG